MKFATQFSSENILMSICGHLILVALLITSAMVVIDRAHLVAPDRIEIIEIDLDNVHVSGDKTKLFNTAADVAPDPVEKPQVKTAPTPTPTESETPITEPTLADTADNVDTEQKQEESPADVEKIENAPKKRTVVRVNRETVGLNRTLTVSVVDALRVAMTRCWTIDSTYPGIGDIRAVAHLKMRKNGTVMDVWFESAARADDDPAFAYVLNTIRSAINVCQPFRMLPPNEYDSWQDITLTFYPVQGKVM